MLAAVQVSLLLTGIAAFLWAVPYEDGGLLDEFFKVNQTNSSLIELVDLQLTSQYLLSRLERRLFQPDGGVNLEVLQFLPADLGGGEQGVAAARNSPNRSPVVSILIITILVLTCLCCIGILVLTCACCCHCNVSCCRKGKTKGFPQKPLDSARADPDNSSSDGGSRSTLLDRLNNGAFANLPRTPRAHKGMQICHILLTVLSAVFLFGLLVSTCVYLYGGALPAATFEKTSLSTEASTHQLSIANAVQYTKDKFIAFLRLGTSTGETLTEEFSVEVDRKLNVSLADGVHTAINALLEKYTIRALLNTGDQLKVDVNILDQNMLFIRKTNQFTSGQVSQIQGSLKTIHGFITTELSQLCLKGLGPYLDTQCKQLQAKSIILNISFDPSAIEVDPPAVLNFVLNDFGINLQLILNQFEKVTQKLNETEMHILLKVLEFIDVQTILKPLRHFWQQLNVQIDNVSTTAQTTVTSIENGLTTAKPLLLLAIYLPAVIFVGLLALAIVLFFLYLFEALESNLFLTEPPTNHQGSPKLPDPAMSSKVCSNCGFIAYAVIMILLLCLLGALLLILPLTMLLASEGCTYLESASGAAKTDYLLNRYIQQAWPLILDRTLNSSSANDNITPYLLLEPPRDLIKAATRTCRNSTNGTLEAGHVGLLNLTGWHTIINVSKLIESDTVNGTIQRGQQVLLDEIKKVNIAGFLPNDLEKMTELAKNLTQYFDKIDYGPSIEQLRPNLLPTESLSSFANELGTFGKAIEEMGLSEYKVLSSAAQVIKEMIPKIQPVVVNVSELRMAFENVQNRRNLTESINALMAELEEVKKIVSNDDTLLAPVPGIYQDLVKQILAQLQIDLSDQVALLTRRLLPCVELYQATSFALAATCRQEGLLSRFYAWSLSLALCLLFALLFFFNVFNLSVLQSQQFSRLGIRNNPLEEQAKKLAMGNRYVPEPRFAAGLPPNLRPLPHNGVSASDRAVFGRTFQPY